MYNNDVGNNVIKVYIVVGTEVAGGVSPSQISKYIELFLYIYHSLHP